jgi:hypothetical protein
MNFIKWHDNTLKKLGTFNSWVFEPLLRDILDLQTFFFKLMMKTQVHKAMENPKDKNSIIQSWHQLGTNNLLLVYLFEIINITQLVIVQVVYIVEDEFFFHIHLHELQASKLVLTPISASIWMDYALMGVPFPCLSFHYPKW